MKFLFNFLLLIPLIVELDAIFRPIKTAEFNRRYREAKSSSEGIDSLSKDDRSMLAVRAVYYVIMLIGLLSSQWIIFMTMIILNGVFSALRTGKYAIGVFIDALICFSLVSFAIINGMHMHYNLYKLISMF
jgi:hypothetical protein